MRAGPTGPIATCSHGEKCETEEYEPLASFSLRVGNKDLAFTLHCVDLCNRYGLDAIALSEGISWSMKLHQRGLLSSAEAHGLDLSWGNQATIEALINRMAHRDGFGDVLVDSVRAVARKLGRGEELAVHSKGLEVFQADVRTSKAYGLGTAEIALVHRGRWLVE